LAQDSNDSLNPEIVLEYCSACPRVTTSVAQRVLLLMSSFQMSQGSTAARTLGQSTRPSLQGSRVVFGSRTSIDSDSLLGSYLVTDERIKVICGCRCSGNMRVLALTALLFMIITVAQTIGAVISNSEALLADCVSMAVDAGTYFLNMLAETQKGTRLHRWFQLIIPAVSLSLLIYFTLDVIREAVGNLSPGSNEDESVNPSIVFAFALWGIIFDIASLYAFTRNQKKSGGQAGINMVAAFMHVAADFARSITTLTESILLFAYPNWNGVVIDAWSCLVVSVTILCGAAYALYEWVKELSEFIRTGE